MKFSLDDEALTAQFPTIGYPMRELNVQLRSFCITGDSEAIRHDDGDFPRITAVEFDEKEAAKAQRILENTRIGKTPKNQTYVTVSAEIDYGNGYLETRSFTPFKDDAEDMINEIHEKGLFLFRSLYGYRKGSKS